MRRVLQAVILVMKKLMPAQRARERELCPATARAKNHAAQDHHLAVAKLKSIRRPKKIQLSLA